MIFTLFFFYLSIFLSSDCTLTLKIGIRVLSKSIQVVTLKLDTHRNIESLYRGITNQNNCSYSFFNLSISCLFKVHLFHSNLWYHICLNVHT